MSVLTELRKHLGISQQFLASYLLVHRSLLNMAEMNQRTLPGDAMLKLTPMLQCMYATNKVQPHAEELPPANHTEPNKNLLNEAIACEITVYNLRKKLADTQQRYAQALHAKAMAEHLALHGKTADASSEKDAEWIELLKNKAEVDLQNFGPAEQAMLQWKLDWYSYGAERARELAGATKTDDL